MIVVCCENHIFVFFFHWHYFPLWALVCRTMSFHFFLSATNSLHLLTPSTWRFLSTSTFHLFLGLPLLLVPSSSWVKIFLGILSSSILSRWPNQLILCPFIHFTIFSPLLISSSSRFAQLFHSPFWYCENHIEHRNTCSYHWALKHYIKERDMLSTGDTHSEQCLLWLRTVMGRKYLEKPSPKQKKKTI